LHPAINSYKGGVTAPLETADKRKTSLMRFAYQAYVFLQYIEFAQFCRPDKAFTPHPA